VFMGNIYAHSLLVRDNLILVAALVSLLYASSYNTDTPRSAERVSPPGWWGISRPYLGAVLAALALLLTAAAAYEVRTSYRKSPFTTDVQCQVHRAQTPDGWTAGLYHETLPMGARGFRFIISAVHPDVGAHPLHMEVRIVHAKRGVLATQEFTIGTPGAHRIGTALPAGEQVDDDHYRAELRLQRCFIPKNMGINADGRRLGVLIKSLEID